MTPQDVYAIKLQELRQAAAEFAHRFAEAEQASRGLVETDSTREAGARAHRDVLAVMRQLRDHIPGAREIFAQLNEVT